MLEAPFGVLAVTHRLPPHAANSTGLLVAISAAIATAFVLCFANPDRHSTVEGVAGGVRYEELMTDEETMIRPVECTETSRILVPHKAPYREGHGTSPVRSHADRAAVGHCHPRHSLLELDARKLRHLSKPKLAWATSDRPPCRARQNTAAAPADASSRLAGTFRGPRYPSNRAGVFKVSREPVGSEGR